MAKITFFKIEQLPNWIYFAPILTLLDCFQGIS